MNNPKDWLSPQKAAQLLMISPITLRQWASSGKIKAATTPGGHRRFLKSDVLALAEANVDIFTGQDDALMQDTKKVLIVDDDVDFNAMLHFELSLQYEGWQFETALDGFDAGLKVAEWHPTILLLDLFLPGCHGDKVCHQIRSNPEFRRLRIIGMTGDTGEYAVSRFLDAGADEVLQKPFKMKRLFELLEE
ncbi:response regulator [Alteromonas sediminis]|uniref:Response regulator n=1 Tax=Alteromonas sediminis TaxID=2259342 RepID=A0A3N5Y1C7_9ALTE|nr:response regulator [Alteromonas sediminis]RPJ67637.1 response regulator [Alteromonas sediminis]